MHDPLVPVDEAMRALEDAVRAGKVLYPALSNWAAWQVQQALGVQEAHLWARIQAIQPMYNLVKRQAEVEILPMAAANGVSVFPYSPAAAGLLSGKYSASPGQGRLVANKMYTARYGEEWAHEVADKFVAFCKQRGMHPVSAAVAWVWRASRGDRADHRRAQRAAAPGFPRLDEDRDERGAVERDGRAVAHPAARHRPTGRAEEGLIPCAALSSTSASRCCWTTSSTSPTRRWCGRAPCPAC